MTHISQAIVDGLVTPYALSRIVFAHRGRMPRISSFYGIVIRMYYDEIRHRGRPHFHATYGDDAAVIDIEALAMIAGHLPRRARRLVIEWARIHRQELRNNWERARSKQPLRPIDPLQ